MRFGVAAWAFNTGDHFFSYLKDASMCFMKEAASNPEMLSIVCMPGDWPPGRFRALQRFLDYIEAQ